MWCWNYRLMHLCCRLLPLGIIMIKLNPNSIWFDRRWRNVIPKLVVFLKTSRNFNPKLSETTLQRKDLGKWGNLLFYLHKYSLLTWYTESTCFWFSELGQTNGDGTERLLYKGRQAYWEACLDCTWGTAIWKKWDFQWFRISWSYYGKGRTWETAGGTIWVCDLENSLLWVWLKFIDYYYLFGYLYALLLVVFPQ